MRSDSIWQLRRRLLFGQMYEDFEIERRVFPPRSRVFCIASAGCTAIALSREHHVTAVDLNPAQVRYAQDRASGAPMRLGAIERVIGFERDALVLAGWTRKRLDRFLQFSDCNEQLEFWHTHLNTAAFRALFDGKLACNAPAVHLFTRDNRLPFLNLGSVLRRRLERGFGRHANRTNPYAHRLFGCARSELREGSNNRIWFETTDAISFLESVAPGSFDGFSLSNIVDGATIQFRKRLAAAVRHAGSGAATVVLRSFAEPENDAAAEMAAQDRALLWGSIQAVSAEAIH